MRLIILLRDRRLLPYPAVEPVPRDAVIAHLVDKGDHGKATKEQPKNNSQYEFIELPRTKRVARNTNYGELLCKFFFCPSKRFYVLSVPQSGASRSWQLPDRAPNSANASRFARLDRARVVAEALYLLEPLGHLAALGRYGEKSWRPFIISLSCDLTR